MSKTNNKFINERNKYFSFFICRQQILETAVDIRNANNVDSDKAGHGCIICKKQELGKSLQKFVNMGSTKKGSRIQACTEDRLLQRNNNRN